jgi:hypothetical protein
VVSELQKVLRTKEPETSATQEIHGGAPQHRQVTAAGGNEAKRAFAAMMPMKKIDVAAIEAARRA